MAAVGLAVFAAVLWGAILGVALVFLYEVYAIARDHGRFAPFANG